MKVLIPKSGIEILDCDRCSQFIVYKTNGDKEQTPDFLVYLHLPTENPLFCFIEFKSQPIIHAISQIKSGVRILQSRYKYFSVNPEPQILDCVIARNRRKGMAHAAQLAVLRGTTISYKGTKKTIRFVNWGDKLFPKLGDEFY